jgi:DNA-binding protein, YbaB/EbfC family
MAKGGYRGGYPGGGGNQMDMMRKAQKMQQEFLKMQNELESSEFEFTAGGGAVKAVVSGTRQFKSIEIDPEVVDPEDVEMLQDLILSAVNGALKASDEKTNESMSKLQSGMGIGGFPGMF